MGGTMLVHGYYVLIQFYRDIHSQGQELHMDPR